MPNISDAKQKVLNQLIASIQKHVDSSHSFWYKDIKDLLEQYEKVDERDLLDELVDIYVTWRNTESSGDANKDKRKLVRAIAIKVMDLYCNDFRNYLFFKEYLESLKP